MQNWEGGARVANLAAPDRIRPTKFLRVGTCKNLSNLDVAVNLSLHVAVSVLQNPTVSISKQIELSSEIKGRWETTFGNERCRPVPAAPLGNSLRIRFFRPSLTGGRPPSSPIALSTTVPLTLAVLKPILTEYGTGAPSSPSESLAKGDAGYVCTNTVQVRSASYLTSLL
jgi:hypothetical protein